MPAIEDASCSLHCTVELMMPYWNSGRNSLLSVPYGGEGCCLGPEGNRVSSGVGGEGGPGPQTRSKISSRTLARKVATWSRRKKGRRARGDEDDPAYTEWALLKDSYQCIWMLLNCQWCRYWCHICFRRINLMALNPYVIVRHKSRCAQFILSTCRPLDKPGTSWVGERDEARTGKMIQVMIILT